MVGVHRCCFLLTVDIHNCNDSGIGRNYVATVALFFTEYTVSMVVAVCIATIGSRGNCKALLNQIKTDSTQIECTICFEFLQVHRLKHPSVKQ